MGGTAHAYSAGGTECIGYFAPAQRHARAGVLLLHEAPGLGAHMRRRADALSALGYAALAADLHGSGQLARTPQEARALVGALKAAPELLMGRLDGALAALSEASGLPPSQTAAAGYCFGGWCALELARAGAPIKSTSVFHGSLESQRGASRIRGSVLVCVGDADPFSPMDQITSFQSEMSQAAVDYQLCLLGGVRHGFTDCDIASADPAFAYNAKADARSWAAFVSLLAEPAGERGQLT